MYNNNPVRLDSSENKIYLYCAMCLDGHRYYYTYYFHGIAEIKDLFAESYLEFIAQCPEVFHDKMNKKITHKRVKEINEIFLNFYHGQRMFDALTKEVPTFVLYTRGNKEI